MSALAIGLLVSHSAAFAAGWLTRRALTRRIRKAMRRL